MPPSVETASQENPSLVIKFSQEHLDYLNEKLKRQTPQRILEWAIITLPNLYQTTAFGLTGLVQLDLINKISRQQGVDHIVPLIFVDTLYHFDETIELSKRCVEKYNVPLHVYKPAFCETVKDFERLYGENFWVNYEDSYDYLVKVEPARRAYDELKVGAVITGRRRSQKGDRSDIPIVEVDSTGLIKVNPLAYWGYQDVWNYIKENDVPYNPLHDKGYKSIGDYHSTVPVSSENEDERSGRWKGKEKTECGLHTDYFKTRSAHIVAEKRREQERVTNTPVNQVQATV